MRLRNVKNAKEIIMASPYYISEMDDGANLFKEIHPIHLEIGMGKGDFIIGMAEKYPNINFIGVEKYESVLVRAVQKLMTKDLPNLRLLCIDAKNIPPYLFKQIATIYLNFSDPWPKKRHAKRRLTSPDFLKLYDELFEGEAHIIEKTDNLDLFAYSLVSLSNYGYYLKNVSLDLEHADIPNVLTEYESKFRQKGVKINYLEAVKPRKK